MHEDLAAVVAGEEAIPLVGVVPLDLAGRHAQNLTLRELTTTSDQVTGRMLWAVLRLSVRDAGSQLRLPQAASPRRRDRGSRDRTGRVPSAGARKPEANGPGGNPGPLVCRDFLAQKSMSPPPPGMAGALSFSGFSAITASVVRNRPAIDAAFCSAERVTFAGSMMPALNMSTYSPVEASRP